MGSRQGVFEGDWKIKESCLEGHIVPVVMDQFIHDDIPVSITHEGNCNPRLLILLPRRDHHLSTRPFYFLQLNENRLTDILKRRMGDAKVDCEGYNNHSFRSGMACTVVANQGRVIGGANGVFYADALLEYVETVGRWTNTE